MDIEIAMDVFNLKTKNAALLGSVGVLGANMTKGIIKVGANVAAYDSKAESAEKVIKESVQEKFIILMLELWRT